MEGGGLMAGGLYWIYLILNRIPLLVVFVGWLPAVGESDFFGNGRCGSAGECLCVPVLYLPNPKVCGNLGAKITREEINHEIVKLPIP